jgi:hypothetical protein
MSIPEVAGLVAAMGGLDGDLDRGIIVSEAPKSASGRPLKGPVIR